MRAVKEKLNPNPSNKKELRKLIQGKIHSDQNELLYGLPGVLLLANFIYEPNESDSINVMLDQMLSTREMDSQSNALVWSQNFAGKKLQFLGVAHGTVGNYSIILEVLAKKGRQKRLEAISNLEKILKTYAQIEEDCCNWPVSLQITSLKQDTVKPLVHWCHGAAGVVTALATKISKVESELIHDLLLKAGNLIWKAGPLEKGISFPHKRIEKQY